MLGDDNGVSYLVMELLDGESLADRLERGPLPLADVLRYGAHIADALDRAPTAGIVHRDLKPGNVMIVKSGAKLLDFGLARSGVVERRSRASPGLIATVRRRATLARPGISKTLNCRLTSAASHSPRSMPIQGLRIIWVYDLGAANATRFSYAATYDHLPNWSPDANRIMFESVRNGDMDVFVKTFGGDEQLLYHSDASEQPTDWSRDGDRIVFQKMAGATKWDIWTLSLKDQVTQAVIQTPANEKDGQISPDGRWLLYTSDESGRSEVYVSRFPSGVGRWQISLNGGLQPRWRRDGREILFLSPDRNMMACTVRPQQNDFDVTAPLALFQTQARNSGERSYDVSGDGQRFLINTTVLDQPATPFVVVLDPFLLRRTR